MPRVTRPLTEPLPVTTAQLRCLHALGRERRLSHDDLRATCGVESLSLLSRDEAATVIDRLQGDRPSPRTRRRSTPGPRLVGAATDKQRDYLRALWTQLGYKPDGLDAWLRQRHECDGVADAHLMRDDASSAIVELQNALKKAASKQGLRMNTYPDGTHSLTPRRDR